MRDDGAMLKEPTEPSPLFTEVVKHVIATEGGYVDDPNDRGGETNYGISKRQYPSLNIARLTRDDAIAIYYRDYWLAYQCDKLPPAYACFLFDSVINHRAKTAVKFLQQTFRVSVDGILGSETLGAINRFKSNSEHIRASLLLSFAYRADFYHDLVVENASQERFLMGWLRRLFSLQQFIEREIFQSDKEKG